MNKYWKTAIAAALLLGLSVSLVACGKNSDKPGNQTESQTQGQTQGTNPDGSAAGTQGTEDTTTPSAEDTDVGSGRPTVSGDTEVGSGREEGETPAPSTRPTTGNTDADTGLSMSFQEYMALGNLEQQKFYDEYFANDPLGFASWFQRIKAAYDEGRQEIDATGPVDIGDYINP